MCVWNKNERIRRHSVSVRVNEWASEHTTNEKEREWESTPKRWTGWHVYAYVCAGMWTCAGEVNV